MSAAGAAPFAIVPKATFGPSNTAFPRWRGSLRLRAQIEVNGGIMPSAGATIRMTERAGLGNALRYLLAREEVDAETALSARVHPRSGRARE
jgi:hypothetical protein